MHIPSPAYPIVLVVRRGQSLKIKLLVISRNALKSHIFR